MNAPSTQEQQPPVGCEVSRQGRIYLLWATFGLLGVHRLYAGKVSGLIYPVVLFLCLAYWIPNALVVLWFLVPFTILLGPALLIALLTDGLLIRGWRTHPSTISIAPARISFAFECLIILAPFTWLAITHAARLLASRDQLTSWQTLGAPFHDERLPWANAILFSSAGLMVLGLAGFWYLACRYLILGPDRLRGTRAVAWYAMGVAVLVGLTAVTLNVQPTEVMNYEDGELWFWSTLRPLSWGAALSIPAAHLISARFGNTSASSRAIAGVATSIIVLAAAFAWNAHRPLTHAAVIQGQICNRNQVFIGTVTAARTVHPGINSAQSLHLDQQLGDVSRAISFQDSVCKEPPEIEVSVRVANVYFSAGNRIKSGEVVKFCAYSWTRGAPLRLGEPVTLLSMADSMVGSEFAFNLQPDSIFTDGGFRPGQMLDSYSSPVTGYFPVGEVHTLEAQVRHCKRD